MERLPALQVAEQGTSVNKCRHSEQFGSTELTPNNAADGEAPFNFQQFQYSFTQVGEIVAVYYVEDFYICEVTSIPSDSEGNINFMEKARTSAKGCCMYRWPSPPDSCTISLQRFCFPSLPCPFFIIRMFFSCRGARGLARQIPGFQAFLCKPVYF